MSDRAALQERARELSGTHSAKSIARQLGVSDTTVGRWLNPERAERDRATSRAWKRSTTGTCKTCGKTTGYSGYNGKGVSDECTECHHARQHEDRYWKPERVIAAIQRFAAEHGRPPVATDWLYGSHGIEEDGYPNATTVLRECGSWANAIEAAGFPRPGIGVPRKYSDDDLIERVREASQDGVAPSQAQGLGRNLAHLLRGRGVSWPVACERAGVRPRCPKLCRPIS